MPKLFKKSALLGHGSEGEPILFVYPSTGVANVSRSLSLRGQS
jgi:hypothetical protein